MSLASSSFLSLLNDDVLAYIFHLCTDTPDTERRYGVVLSIYALDTARHTSQVCRSWRQLMIQSPTIWANTIDLDRLTPASEHWTQEVLRRTGDAKLSIYGIIHQDRIRPLIKPRIISLLEENWHRARSVTLHLIGQDHDHIDKRLWDLFWTFPAPSLEAFIVHGAASSALEANRNRNDGLTMFSGSAPVLRHMHFRPLRVDHRISWLPHLLSLTLADPPTLLSALKAIASCPLLESLSLSLGKEYSVEELSCNEDAIHLPNLQIFNLSSNANTSLVILSTIIPRTDCALSLSVDDTSTHLRHRDTLQQLLKIISHYGRFHSVTHRPTELIFVITNCIINISLNNRNKVVSFRDPNFHIFFNLRDMDPDEPSLFDHPVIDNLLSTVAHANLAGVHYFLLNLDSHPSWYPSTDESIHVFHSLTSVTKMKLTPSSIRALNTLSHTHSPSLFPSLVEATITFYGADQRLALKTHLPVFLSLRKRGGKPLRVLYLQTDFTFQVEKHEWAFLEEYDGLRCFRKYLIGPVEDFYRPTG